jgi:ribosomal protein S12 methylthiotransferase accessory factor
LAATSVSPFPWAVASERELAGALPLADVARLPRAVGSRYSPDLRILWVEARALGDGPRWLPYACVHTDFTVEPKPGDGCFSESSNGLASGNHPDEALLHGLCEVIERDAAVRWHLRDGAAQASTRIDPATVRDEANAALLARCARAGLLVGLWELTSDAGVPAFLCQVTTRAEEPLRPLPPSAGMGCHPAREVALSRAITEAAQSRLVMVSGSRDDVFRADYERTLDRDAAAAHRALLARPGGRPFGNGPDPAGDDLRADLDAVVGRLRAIGCEEVLAVDLSRPELGVPVVRAVVPGLEGPDALHGPAVHGRRARAVLERRA